MISPLPWKVSILNKVKQPVIFDAKGQVVTGDLGYEPDDANYIVKACNLFPELIRLLDEAVIDVEHKTKKNGYTTDFNPECIHCQINKIINEANT